MAWDRRWERYFQALKQAGVGAGFHEFYREWIWSFIKTIKSKSWREAESRDVEPMTWAQKDWPDLVVKVEREVRPGDYGTKRLGD